MSRGYPLHSQVDLLSPRFCVGAGPFRAKLFATHLSSSGEHRWNVVDNRGEMVFAGMMTMAAAYETEEILNTRAATMMMLSN